MSLAEAVFTDFEVQMNLATVLLSLVAVVYWVRLFRHIEIRRKQDVGWAWIFVAVLTVLLLNISGLMFVFSDETVAVGATRVLKFDLKTITLINTLSRTIIAVSTTIGAYLIYTSVGKPGKFTLSIEPVSEAHVGGKSKYDLKPGTSYFIETGKGDGGVAAELFTDLVKHGVQGLCITRTYPPKMRQQYGLQRTPIVWMTKERGYDESIEPDSLISFSHTVKEFIFKSQDCVVLIDGIEYLISQNNFDDVLKIIQSIDDVVMQKNARLVISADPSALDERQLHLLKRELNEYIKED